MQKFPRKRQQRSIPDNIRDSLPVGRVSNSPVASKQQDNDAISVIISQSNADQKANDEISNALNHRRPTTKQDQVLRMLCSEGGTTISDIIKATGWQSHSIRAFFSSVVRKRLQLSLQTRKIGNRKVYFLEM